MKKVLIGVVGLLVVVIAITGYVNWRQSAALREAQANATLAVTWGDDNSATLSMQQVQALPAEEFAVVQRSSDAPDSDQVFKGVALKVALSEQGVPLDDSSLVTVKAADGYAVALTGSEVLQDENVYLVYQRGGEPLGTKASGGTGPFQLVIRQDTYAQRWCKFVSEIQVK
ncbi:MAG: molybdopterin-dependent oxidoreductase [Bacillota bacterium]|jgi:DMSO/TMAO reductase YedYZ molybdopterin-dependent catalytic subunit